MNVIISISVVCIIFYSAYKIKKNKKDKEIVRLDGCSEDFTRKEVRKMADALDKTNAYPEVKKHFRNTANK